MNPRITPKERNLIKGAIRRVFSRSDLRRAVIGSCIVVHNDPSRPRVKTWCLCPSCKGFIPKSYMQVDHIIPVIKVTESLESLTWDEVVDRLWCEYTNLKAICITCHTLKTKEENRARRAFRKAKDNETKSSKSPPNTKEVRINRRKRRRGSLWRV